MPALESRTSRAHGFTLVETIVTLLVMSVAVLGVMFSVSFAAKNQAAAGSRSASLTLAQAYFEEIAALRFDENTPVGGVPACAPTTTPCSLATAFNDGESRELYDDVDDFDGLDESPPRDARGESRSGYDGFRVQASVRYLTLAEVGALGVDLTTDAKVVTLSVTPPGGQPRVFTALRSNF